ncbi:hypothetical protein C0J52_27314, partial [Blattella germanica]
ADFGCNFSSPVVDFSVLNKTVLDLYLLTSGDGELSLKPRRKFSPFGLLSPSAFFCVHYFSEEELSSPMKTRRRVVSHQRTRWKRIVFGSINDKKQIVPYHSFALLFGKVDERVHFFGTQSQSHLRCQLFLLFYKSTSLGRGDRYSRVGRCWDNHFLQVNLTGLVNRKTNERPRKRKLKVSEESIWTSKYMMSRYTYKLGRETLFLDDLRQKVLLPTTKSYKKIIEERRLKQREIPEYLYTMKAMTDWCFYVFRNLCGLLDIPNCPDVNQQTFPSLILSYICVRLV